MTWLEICLVLLAGLWAGTINAVVGSGTLVTFPVLVALGYSPLVATVSNGIGLVAGGVSGAWGYRRELRGQGRRLAMLLPASVVGGALGAVMLLRLPESSFETVVPVLIVVALVLVVLQPRLQARLRRRNEARVAALAGGPADGGAVVGAGSPPQVRASRWLVGTTVLATFLIGVYGGYFTAAQGVMLVAVLGSLLDETLQRVNGLKNVLTLVVNVVSAAFYVLFGYQTIDWLVVALIAASSLVGGAIGARYGRRLPPTALRAAIVVLGVVALLRILGTQVGWW
ncbi:sulfite exporter TauE/SafE family protein [Quadrisphaera oryzae]|uniref:sulfite exporter TauE/SafE family protein n=1 Tax=Quadrisphaera TaxID=317661 RepID=UPI00164962E8|nr:sulfite exporter TauE/SafE family protein [Quadrisphaera sp. RL12-1S]